MKALVVYYSRTGFTGKVADEISLRLGCESEEVLDLKDRSGAMGYLYAGRDAMKGALTELKPTVKNPLDYDIVIVGTPVWAWTLSAPIRTYLSANRGKFKGMAFFCTMGGSGADGTFKAMEDVCGLKPKATMVLKTAEVSVGGFRGKVDEFVKSLRG